jgi:hypothetical protein
MSEDTNKALEQARQEAAAVALNELMALAERLRLLVPDLDVPESAWQTFETQERLERLIDMALASGLLPQSPSARGAQKGQPFEEHCGI